jgi:hypothetical protein
VAVFFRILLFLIEKSIMSSTTTPKRRRGGTMDGRVWARKAGDHYVLATIPVGFERSKTVTTEMQLANIGFTLELVCDECLFVRKHRNGCSKRPGATVKANQPLITSIVNMPSNETFAVGETVIYGKDSSNKRTGVIVSKDGLVYTLNFDSEPSEVQTLFTWLEKAHPLANAQPVSSSSSTTTTLPPVINEAPPTTNVPIPSPASTSIATSISTSNPTPPVAIPPVTSFTTAPTNQELDESDLEDSSTTPNGLQIDQYTHDFFEYVIKPKMPAMMNGKPNAEWANKQDWLSLSGGVLFFPDALHMPTCMKKWIGSPESFFLSHQILHIWDWQIFHAEYLQEPLCCTACNNKCALTRDGWSTSVRMCNSLTSSTFHVFQKYAHASCPKARNSGGKSCFSALSTAIIGQLPPLLRAAAFPFCVTERTIQPASDIPLVACLVERGQSFQGLEEAQREQRSCLLVDCEKSHLLYNLWFQKQNKHKQGVFLFDNKDCTISRTITMLVEPTSLVWSKRCIMKCWELECGRQEPYIQASMNAAAAGTYDVAMDHQFVHGNAGSDTGSTALFNLLRCDTREVLITLQLESKSLDDARGRVGRLLCGKELKAYTDNPAHDCSFLHSLNPNVKVQMDLFHILQMLGKHMSKKNVLYNQVMGRFSAAIFNVDETDVKKVEELLLKTLTPEEVAKKIRCRYFLANRRDIRKYVVKSGEQIAAEMSAIVNEYMAKGIFQKTFLDQFGRSMETVKRYVGPDSGVVYIERNGIFYCTRGTNPVETFNKQIAAGNLFSFSILHQHLAQLRIANRYSRHNVVRLGGRLLIEDLMDLVRAADLHAVLDMCEKEGVLVLAGTHPQKDFAPLDLNVDPHFRNGTLVHEPNKASFQAFTKILNDRQMALADDDLNEINTVSITLRGKIMQYDNSTSLQLPDPKPCNSEESCLLRAMVRTGTYFVTKPAGRKYLDVESGDIRVTLWEVFGKSRGEIEKIINVDGLVLEWNVRLILAWEDDPTPAQEDITVGSVTVKVKDMSLKSPIHVRNALGEYGESVVVKQAGGIKPTFVTASAPPNAVTITTDIQSSAPTVNPTLHHPSPALISTPGIALNVSIPAAAPPPPPPQSSAVVTSSSTSRTNKRKTATTTTTTVTTNSDSKDEPTAKKQTGIACDECGALRHTKGAECAFLNWMKAPNFQQPVRLGKTESQLDACRRVYKASKQQLVAATTSAPNTEDKNPTTA